MNERKEFVGTIVFYIGFAAGIITAIIFREELIVTIAEAASWLLNQIEQMR